ncbi:MAG TPA: hypothetical protein VG453_01085 [Nitrospira sp.]|jgi:hypothetical protein|nr:hypothetical protein [Nitrospira sp.]
MTDTKNHTAGVPSLEGRVFRPASRAELAEAVELAFDYRGDVTLELATGGSVAGYLFNRDAAGSDPWIEVFPTDDPAPRRIAYAEIASLAFTGEDTANGRSWEAWVSKKESERRDEAARVEADARTRGHL